LRSPTRWPRQFLSERRRREQLHRSIAHLSGRPLTVSNRGRIPRGVEPAVRLGSSRLWAFRLFFTPDTCPEIVISRNGNLLRCTCSTILISTTKVCELYSGGSTNLSQIAIIEHDQNYSSLSGVEVFLLFLFLRGLDRLGLLFGRCFSCQIASAFSQC
jgi:hypothetical protein